MNSFEQTSPKNNKLCPVFLNLSSVQYKANAIFTSDLLYMIEPEVIHVSIFS